MVNCCINEVDNLLVINVALSMYISITMYNSNNNNNEIISVRYFRVK